MVLTAVLVLAIGGFFVVKNLKPDPKTASSNAKIVGQSGNKGGLRQTCKIGCGGSKTGHHSAKIGSSKGSTFALGAAITRLWDVCRRAVSTDP